MFKYVVIEDGVVIGSQESEMQIISPNLLLVDALPSLFSIYENGVFTAPIIEPILSITLGHFSSRFTLAEKVALENAAIADLEVKVILKDFDRSKNINLSDLELQWALALLIQKGLITKERLSVLLKDGTQAEAV
jgi:hypothetical protein